MKNFTSVLFIVFLVLRLTHYIDWSWWWITAPIWGGAIVYVLFFMGYIFYLEACGTPEQRMALRMKGYIKW